MILVDSSVWIDYFNGIGAPHTDELDRLLGSEILATGDLILAEVLQGFDGDHEFHRAKKALMAVTVVELAGEAIALRAARNFRKLRKLGITVRKTIDALIATRCIESNYILLHNDRDFKPFAKYLGLRTLLSPFH